MAEPDLNPSRAVPVAFGQHTSFLVPLDLVPRPDKVARLPGGASTRREWIGNFNHDVLEVLVRRNGGGRDWGSWTGR